jgi:hypothetical protein
LSIDLLGISEQAMQRVYVFIVTTLLIGNSIRAETSSLTRKTSPARIAQENHLNGSQDLSDDQVLWRAHWAFQPIQDPQPPAVTCEDWPQNDIDHFILARLEQKKLSPSPRANRHTLLRRMSWDLTGLPYRCDPHGRLLANSDAHSIDHVIDDLLASPHYGERWARHWLDLARYADTKGYVFFEKPEYRIAYTYRDYVIDSLNSDKPYHQFVLEQLAADLLEGEVPLDALAGLGFVTIGPRLKNDMHDIIADRIDVVTRGLLGLTVGCARCHDHKYDPISMEDYYSLYGVFRNSVEPLHLPFRLGDQIPADLQPAADKIRQAALDLDRHYQEKYGKVMRDAQTRLADYLATAQAQRSGPDTVLFDVIVDGDDLSPQLLRLWKQYLEDTQSNGSPVFHPWHVLAKVQREGFQQSASQQLQEMMNPERLHVQPVNRWVWQYLVQQPLETFADVIQAYVQLLSKTDQQWQTLVENATLAGKSPPHTLPDPSQEAYRQAFHHPHSPLGTPYHGFQLLRLFPDRESQKKVKELNEALDAIRAQAPVELAQMLTLEDSKEMIPSRVLERGNPGMQAQVVPRRFIRFFRAVSDQPFQQGSGRLELAQAIVSPANPLTSRVLVNRIWQQHFGQGLVTTPSDFGMQSVAPSHPQLLDHLATWLMNHNWSIKGLHRYIMQSATYQQQSISHELGEQTDPDNSLYWRMNRRRLDFESMRDGLLMVSEQLDLTVGGKSIADGMATTNRRRTLYAHIDRQNLPGVFRTFDFPPPDVSSSTRNNTTVPGQALFLMNHPLVLSCAKQLGEMAQACGSDTLAIECLYQHILQRDPHPEELPVVRAYLAPEETQPLPDQISEWQALAQVLLMSNEFQFVD